MADPITDPDIVAPTRDPNSDTNPFFNSIVQGGNTAGVSAAGDLQVEVGVALPAGTNNIGDVDVLTAPGTAAEGAALPALFIVVAGDDGTDTHPLQVNAVGDLKVTLDSESVVVTATDLDIRNLSETTDHVLIFANTVKDGTGTDLVPLLDADGHLQIDVLSIPATSEQAVTENQDTAVSTASGSSTNHDMSVTLSTTRRLYGFSVAAAGGGRYELQKGPAATLATVDIFLVKPGVSSLMITLPKPIDLAEAGGSELFRLIKLNRSGQAQDMHSTFYFRTL